MITKRTINQILERVQGAKSRLTQMAYDGPIDRETVLRVIDRDLNEAIETLDYAASLAD